MEKGLKVIYENGEIEHYDPVTDFEVTVLTYNFFVGGYFFSIHIADTKKIEWYDICDECKYELPGSCKCETN